MQMNESKNRRNIKVLHEDAVKLESFNCFANHPQFVLQPVV